MDTKRRRGRINPAWTVYLVGVTLFGLFYVRSEAYLGGGVGFFLAAVGYLLALRLLGSFAAKRWPG